MLIVDQELAFVATLASRVLVMQKGQIPQELASDKLSNRKSSERSASPDGTARGNRCRRQFSSSVHRAVRRQPLPLVLAIALLAAALAARSIGLGSMKLVVLSDIHLVPAGAQLYGLDPAARLARAVDIVNRDHRDIAFVVIAGDLVHSGDCTAYEVLRSILMRLHAPAILLMSA